MKRKIVALLTIFPLIAANIVLSSYFIVLDNQRKNMTIDLTISTIGDSLTDSGHYGSLVEYGIIMEDCYQYYTYKYLKVRNLETRVRNLGIGGQTVAQICGRFNETVPANYIVCMAGTNDMWRADYSAPGINDTLANHIIDTYNDTIFGTITYQQSLGYAPAIIVICSIPSFGNINPPFLYIPEGIQYVNTALESYIQGLNRTDVLFCDVHKAMSTEAGWMINGLCVADGVHFTEAGDQVMGEAVAQVISYNYYHPKH
jgi:lysophospholipase L1-like esterase